MLRELRVVGTVPADARAALGWVARLDTLEDVLRRGLAIAEVIVQDEYTHDVITTGHGIWIVFDTT